IIDSGVNCSLAEFQCVTGLSLILGKSPYQDDNGHGTAVASIAAAKANGSGMKGIAPGASIMPIKVTDANGFLADQDRHRGSGPQHSVSDADRWNEHRQRHVARRPS